MRYKVTIEITVDADSEEDAEEEVLNWLRPEFDPAVKAVEEL